MTPNQIDMFAKAKEIQEAWKPKVGDRVAHKIDRVEQVVCRVEKGLKTGYHLTTSYGRVYTSTVFIFLPDIEWMAERWHEGKDGEKDGEYFFVMLSQYIREHLETAKFTNVPEQIIVLAFIMSELYNKKWDEKKGWVKG